LAIFFDVFVNPIALESIQWKYYVVYCIILVAITLTVYFFYPETNGHSLEEMARIFDGEAAAVPQEGRVMGSISVAKEINGDMKHRDTSHVEKLDV
jgi:hypothetical protein